MFTTATYRFRRGVPADSSAVGPVEALQFHGPHSIAKHQTPLPGGPAWFGWRTTAAGEQLPFVRSTDGKQVQLRPGDFVVDQGGPQVYGLEAFHGMFEVLPAAAAAAA